MRRSDQDRLLSDILGDEGAPDIRQVSLERTLSALRRGRRRQRALIIAASSATVLLACLPLLTLNRPHERAPTQLAQSPRSPSSDSNSQEADVSKVKLITDDELLALFPGRSVGLIGNPGHRRLVFFDEPPAQSSE